MHLVTTSVVESPPKSRLSKSKDIVLKKKCITPIWIYLAVFQLSESVLVFIRLSKK